MQFVGPELMKAVQTKVKKKTLSPTWSSEVSSLLCSMCTLHYYVLCCFCILFYCIVSYCLLCCFFTFTHRMTIQCSLLGFHVVQLPSIQLLLFCVAVCILQEIPAVVLEDRSLKRLEKTYLLVSIYDYDFSSRDDPLG